MIGERSSKPIQSLAGVLAGLLYLISIPAAAEQTGTIAGTVKARGVSHSGDVVVYVEEAKGKFSPQSEPVVIHVKKMNFIPRVLPVLLGSSIRFANNDMMQHHAMGIQKRKTIFDLPLPHGFSKPVVLSELGPVAILDAQHPEMSAYIVVLQNPFFAKTDEKGDYVFENVPPGTYTLKAWHDKLKPESKEVKVSEGSKIRVDFELRR